MYFLLPPSETKATGGSGPFSLEQLTFSGLADARSAVLSAYGPAELERAPGMAAIDRYTGTLFSAVHGRGLKGTPTADNSLNETERELAKRSVFIQSALFGLVSALDPIPSYKLNPARLLNGLNLKTTWAQAHSAVWQQLAGRPIIDLRSKAYAQLAPIPEHLHAFTVSVFVQRPDGQLEQLNHFNKKAKGQLVRSVLTARSLPNSIDELAERAGQGGIRLEVSDRILTVVTR